MARLGVLADACQGSKPMLKKKKVLGKPRSCVVFWEVFGDDMWWRQVWALKYGLSKLHEHNPLEG